MSATERTATLLLEPDISMSAQSAVCFKPVCWDSVKKWSRTGRLTCAAPGLDDLPRAPNTNDALRRTLEEIWQKEALPGSCNFFTTEDQDIKDRVTDLVELGYLEALPGPFGQPFGWQLSKCGPILECKFGIEVDKPLLVMDLPSKSWADSWYPCHCLTALRRSGWVCKRATGGKIPPSWWTV